MVLNGGINISTRKIEVRRNTANICSHYSFGGETNNRKKEKEKRKAIDEDLKLNNG